MAALKTSTIIADENAADLSAFIKASAGRTKAPSVTQVLAAAFAAEADLENAGVAKSHRVGCEYSYCEAGPWANSYGYAKAVVAFKLRRKKDGWVIVNAHGQSVYPKTPERDQIVLTPAAKDAVIRYALAPFGMLPVKKLAIAA